MSKEFVFGAMAGAMASSVSNPFETVKTRLQLQGALNRSATVYSEGTLSATAQIVRTEGLATLWKGVTSNIGFHIVLTGMRFGLYSTFNQALGVRPEHDGASLGSWISGTAAGGGAAIIASPFALVRTRLQANSTVASFGHSHAAKTTAEAFNEIIRSEGFTGLWTGSLSQATRVSLTTGAQLAVYDSMKQIIRHRCPKWRQANVNLATALSAGVFTAMMAHPLDVILTRIYHQSASDKWYRGPFDAAIKTVRSEGVSGLYKGFTATLLRQMPHTTVTFLVLEYLRAL